MRYTHLSIRLLIFAHDGILKNRWYRISVTPYSNIICRGFFRRLFRYELPRSFLGVYPERNSPLIYSLTDDRAFTHFSPRASFSALHSINRFVLFSLFFLSCSPFSPIACQSSNVVCIHVSSSHARYSATLFPIAVNEIYGLSRFDFVIEDITTLRDLVLYFLILYTQIDKESCINYVSSVALNRKERVSFQEDFLWWFSRKCREKREKTEKKSRQESYFSRLIASLRDQNSLASRYHFSSYLNDDLL